MILSSRFTFRLFSALVGGLVLAAVPAFAQAGASRPVGYIVQTIPAGQSRSFSIPLDAPASSLANSVGKVTAVGSNWLENAAAAWTPGAFSTAGAPYYLRLTSGAQSGRLFRIVNPANTATRVYVADDGVGLAELGIEVGENGAGYEIIPADTLGTLFGTADDNNLLLQGADTPHGADLVQVWGGASWINFYFNTTWNRWARDLDSVASPSRNAFLLRPDRGVMIARRGDTDLVIPTLGRVLVQPPRAVHTRTQNALTFLATMQATDTTLGELALQTASRTHAWKSSADATEADLLVVWAGASWFSFYFNSEVGHWQRTNETTTNRDGYVIKAGTPIFVQRREVGATAADKTIQFPSIGG